MQNPNFYAAAYMIIENEKWETLFMKRQNTWFRDWYFQLPAGHLEWEESMIDCAIRESKEELCIDILEKDLSVVHISHRISPQEKWWDTRVYFDIYVKIKQYFWTPVIGEPEKCSELKFIDIENISKEDKNLFYYDLDIVKKIKKWEKFSEVK
jgi:ADP-ribose pyrophosphatase YjhB (NUDIX family)